ncbi:MAG: ABC transporter permease subunit [Clostridia bacterium]|nr:ABC transporter permease subunit [Clostridia bacterium]
MGKLIKADLFRILKSKLFLIVAIISLAFPVFMTLMYLALDKILVASAGLTGMSGLGMTGRALLSESFVMSSNMGLILPIFITLFIAMDVSNGTLRNKIIAGRSRKEIYFSHLITASIVSGALILVNVLLFMGCICLVYGYGVPINAEEFVRLVYFFVTGLVTFVFSAAVSTAITLSIQTSAPAVIISTIVGMGLSLITSILHTADLTLTNKWFCLIPTYTNSTFLASGTFDAGSFWLGILSYAVVGMLITLFGLTVFCKKDIK